MAQTPSTVTETKESGAKKSFPVGKNVTYVVLALYVVLLFTPFLVILMASFKTDEEITKFAFHLFPKQWSLEGYKLIFKQDPNAVHGVPSLLVGFFNTMWQTLIPLVGGLITSSLAAYIYSKFRFPGRKVLFTITVLTMMLPMGAFGFVAYLFYMSIGWVGKAGILAVIIPGIFGSGSVIFFMRAYFDSALANEVLEAAKIDGANSFVIFLRIVLPLSKPAIIAQFLLGFVGGYNNYSTALLYLYRDKSMWNLQLALSELIGSVQGMKGGYFNARCAAALMAILPLIVLYCFVQKYFIEGINIGGGKE